MICCEKAGSCCNAPLVMSVEKTSLSEPAADLLHPVFVNTAAGRTEVQECSAEWSLPPEYAHARTALGGAEMGEAVSLCQADCDSENRSEAFILLRSDSGKYLLAGTVTWRKLLMTWIVQRSRLILRIHGDSLTLAGNSRYDADEFVLIERDTLYDVMDSYGRILSARNFRKRKNALWRGWATWDYFRDDFTHDELMEQLEAVRPLLPEKTENLHHLLQVDDGYSGWGDWLELKNENFPKGFDGLVRDANSRGFDVGIWMAPFWVESTSHVAQAHPDWFLRDGNGAVIRKTMVTHTLFLLDYSQDEVCEWWRDTLKTVRSWGIVYFKFDFLAQGLCPAPGKNPMPPLARFHRCFDIISEVLDPDGCYILGCSAAFGPCFGRVDGLRIGPDISPNRKSIRDSAFACTGQFYLQKNVLDCDSDYLVVRGEGERDPARPEPAPGKFGRLSPEEARTWCGFSAINAHIVLAGDNMNFIPDQKKNMIRSVMAQAPADEIFAVDPFAGNSCTAAECILSARGGETSITLFNWDDKEKTTVLTGTGSAPVSFSIQPNSFVSWKYAGEKSFAELARTIRTDRPEGKRKTYQDLIRNFPAPHNAECLSLGPQADCPLVFDRKKQLGMASGRFAPMLGRKIFSGVPFDFSLSGNCGILNPFYDHKRREVELSGKVPVFYLLYSMNMVVKNRVFRVELHFEDGTMTDFPVDCGENIGNSEIRYLFDWHERDAHLSWVDDSTFACMYTARFVNPTPEKTVGKIVLSEPDQRGTLYLIGLTRADS